MLSNPNNTEKCVVVIARKAFNEQESVILFPEPDSIHEIWVRQTSLELNSRANSPLLLGEAGTVHCKSLRRQTLPAIEMRP
jgi:hypothetical protein